MYSARFLKNDIEGLSVTDFYNVHSRHAKGIYSLCAKFCQGMNLEHMGGPCIPDPKSGRRPMRQLPAPQFYMSRN